MSRNRPLTDQEIEATARLMQAFADAVAIGRQMHIYAKDGQRAAMEQIHHQGEANPESTDLLVAKLRHILGPNKHGANL